MIDQKSDNACVVLGQSMKPFFRPGDILSLKKVFPSSIQKGNVISYIRKSNKESVIHRVIKIIKKHDNYTFITKGDNLGKPDGFVTANQIEGIITGRISRGKFVKISKLEELLALL